MNGSLKVGLDPDRGERFPPNHYPGNGVLFGYEVI
jgi:hypothetical protein